MAWPKAFDRFFPKDPLDPRAKQIADRVPYHIGTEWTPSPSEIAAAQKRHDDYRKSAGVRWEPVTDEKELDLARVAIMSATTEPGAVRRAGEHLRVLRTLVRRGEGQFFERNLQVLPDRRLVEYRHEKLRAPGSSRPCGFRFIRLASENWLKKDFMGLYLDGSPTPILDAFGDIFHGKRYPESLIEHYVSFAFDHLKIGPKQYYVVHDKNDFILPDAPAPTDGSDPLLTAQFQLSLPPPPPQKLEGDAADPVLRALQIPKASLAPPTVIRQDDNYATVFATLILDLKLYHVGMRVHANGRITVEKDAYQQRTPPNETLPLIAVRSFAEQRAALQAAFDLEAGNRSVP